MLIRGKIFKANIGHVWLLFFRYCTNYYICNILVLLRKTLRHTKCFFKLNERFSLIRVKNENGHLGIFGGREVTVQWQGDRRVAERQQHNNSLIEGSPYKVPKSSYYHRFPTATPLPMCCCLTATVRLLQVVRLQRGHSIRAVDMVREPANLTIPSNVGLAYKWGDEIDAAKNLWRWTHLCLRDLHLDQFQFTLRRIQRRQNMVLAPYYKKKNFIME